MALTAEQVRQKITAFFSGKGLTAAQIAGIEGNIQIESGFRTDAYNPGENAIGLVQWQRGRRTALQSYAASIGKPETDLDAQLGFIWQEFMGSESGAFAALQAAVTPEQAATVIDQKYERSSGHARAQRIAAALNFFRGGTIPDPKPGTTTPGGAGIPAGADTGGGSVAGVADLGTLGGLLGGLGLDTLGKYVVNGLVVVLGAVLLILGLVLIAQGGESTTVTMAPSRPQDTPPAAPKETAAGTS